MRFNDIQRQKQQYVLQGFLTAFLPISILSADAVNPLLGAEATSIAGLLVPLMLIGGIALLLRNRIIARILCTGGIALNTTVLFFELSANPLLTLFYAVLSTAWLYYLFTAKLFPAKILTADLQNDRLYGSSLGLILLVLLAPLFAYKFYLFPVCCFAAIAITVQQMLHLMQITVEKSDRKFFSLPPLAVAAALLLWGYFSPESAALPTGLLLFIYAHNRKHADWELLKLITRHPARFLLLTFLALSTAGTLLVRTPFAMQQELPLMDAVFTAVSASCVTGLTTVDIAETLTLPGRFILLLLIQLGGLGIMTLATLTLHALGRLSLNQEQLAEAISNSGEQDIFHDLRLIVRFTFIVETIGALLLTWGFYQNCGNFFKSLELGIFTSVSAFCNAGFFPAVGNLEAYANESLLLLIIACEIILGGIAPAVTFAVIKKRSQKNMPFICKLVLGSTAILLAAGTFFLLLFEWNGIFGGMTIWDKFINSFFCSAALRTAGFSTVPITALGMPSYLIMLILMFIGGSPGGTAGGIKTTTAALLFFAFRSALRNESEVTLMQRKVHHASIIQATAVVIAALSILFIVVIMLTATQDLPPKTLLFEAVSALGTVGLSLGITAQLDAVGRIIIIAAMFIGRIGPLTLFLLFSERNLNSRLSYPQIKIPLG